jgi:hypothetical protein
MKINNNTKPTIKHENQTKTKLSPQGPQWSRHSVARVRRRGENIHPQNLILSIYLANIRRQGILVSYQ